MKSYIAGLLCCLVLVLHGCTAEEVAFVELASQSLQESSQMIQQTANQMNEDAARRMPLNNTVNFQEYAQPNRPTSYLINTDSGMEQVQCMTLSTGYVLCY